MAYINSKVFAEKEEFYNLVSIIVEEEIYDSIKEKIKRYALDIQGVMENTRVVIFPTPKDTDPFNIASLNEALYYEWYKWVKDNIDFESRLIWTVLVWDLPIPVVYDWEKVAKTLYPYVDFDDKRYVYNNENQRYEKNLDFQEEFKAEIWHWVINPNSSDWNDEDLIKWYFDKNHDFYEWEWLFKSGSWILNWNFDEKIIFYDKSEWEIDVTSSGTREETEEWEETDTWALYNYEPYVFYYDQEREQAALNKQKFKWYDTYMNNDADMTYYKYDKELAENIEESSFGDQHWEITDLAKEVQQETWKQFDWDLSEDYETRDKDLYPDIQTRHITEESTNVFLETFWDAFIWDEKKFIYNAWRYNQWWTNVNVDLVPYLISVEDQMGQQTIKAVSNAVETKADDEIKAWMSRYIAMPTKIDFWPYPWEEHIFEPTGWEGCFRQLTNFKHWKEGELIKNASECTIYKWNTNWTLVESNRWYNLWNLQSDLERVTADEIPDEHKWKTTWYWWGCSPINIDQEKASHWEIEINDCVLEDAIESLFDIQWSKQIFDDEKIPNPEFCFENNYVFSVYAEWDWCWGWYVVPTSEHEWVDWWPWSEVVHIDFQRQFEDMYQYPTLKPENGLTAPVWWWCEGLCYIAWEAEAGAYDYNGDNKNRKVVLCSELKNMFFWWLIPKVNAGEKPWLWVVPEKPEEWEECDGFLWDSIEWAHGWNQMRCCVKRKIFLDKEQVQEYESWWASACTDVKINGISWTYMWNAWYRGAFWPQVLQPLYDFENKWLSGVAKKVTASCRELNWDVYEAVDYEWEIPAHGGGNNYGGTNWLYRHMNSDGEDFLYIWLPEQFRIRNECAETYYWYKRITSWVEHESPTNQETWAESQAIMTSSLPIDNDRYIDFIWTTRGYHKVDYFKPFNEETSSEREFDMEKISDNLSDDLDVLESSRNKALEEVTIEDLWWQQLEIYMLLKTGEIPSENLDVKKLLWNEEVWGEKESQTYTSNWNEKDLHYWDVFTHNVYMRNMQTITEKYRYVFENFLNDQFGNDYKYVLPKNKKMYEVSYIWAPWDYKNMYIKVDSEENEDNPYADIVSENMILDWYLESSSATENFNDLEQASLSYIDSGNSWTATSWWGFSCWSSNWTSVFGWMSSVDCWVSESMTPKMNFPSTGGSWWESNSGTDGNPSISESEESGIITSDDNIGGSNNGWTDDKSDEVTLDIESDFSKYYYNDKGELKVNVDWFDSENRGYVTFVLERLEEIDDWWNNLVYDSIELNSEEAYSEALRYISFSKEKIRLQWNTAKSFFTTKSKDIDVSFSAVLDEKDSLGNSEKISKSSNVEFEVRWDKLSMKSYKVTNSGSLNVELWQDSIIVSDETNIYLMDNDKWDIESLSGVIFDDSESYEKMVVSIDSYSKEWNDFSITYPINVRIYKDSELVFEELWIKEDALSSFKWLTALQESGDFEIAITDGKWYKVKKFLTMFPEKADSVEIELSPSIIETGRVLTRHSVSVLDKFGNLASWDLYDISIDIDWDGVTFYDEEKLEEVDNISVKTVKWYTKFNLISTEEEGENVLSFTLKDFSWEEISTETKEITTVEWIYLEASSQVSNVWWKETTFILEVKDKEWEILEDFNSIAYIDVNGLYWNIEESFVEIESWKWKFTFISNNLAAKDVKIEFWAEGLNTIDNKFISILPDDPMKIELVLDDNNMEAEEGNYTKLQAQLRDRYWNLVFTDSNTKLVLTIPSNTGWTSPITWPNNENLTNQPYRSIKAVSKWKVDFSIYATMYPWRWYFTVGTSSGSQDLSKNYFDLIWQYPFSWSKLESINWMISWQELTERWKKFFTDAWDYTFQSKFQDKEKLESDDNFLSLNDSIQEKLKTLWDETNKKTIYGVSKNAGNIQTSYYWNKKAFSWKRYNGLYSVLLWAPYWDISKESNLSSDILFDKENRALAVTSIMNDPYKYDDVIAVDNKWALINMLEDATTTTQDIRSEINIDSEDRLYIDLFNDSLNTYIWKVYYNFPEDGVELLDCKEDNIEDCLDKEKTSIILESLDEDNFSVYLKDSNLILRNKYGRDSLIIDESWKIVRKSWIYLDIDDGNEKDYLVLLVKSWEDIIWRILLNFSDANINVTRNEDTLSTKLKTLKNTIVLYLKTKSYWTRQIWDRVIVFFYDPLVVKGELDSFHKDNLNWIENYLEKEWIWWWWENKFLLAFSSWDSVWKATQDYMSFSMINLWDPVLRLKQAQRTFFNSKTKLKHFNSSLWTKLNKDPVENYEVFDYNNDDKLDILFVWKDKKLKLLENKNISNNFVDKWWLVYPVDIWPTRHVKTWDFFGDGYDDIFFVDTDWDPFLFNNDEKDFSRVELKEQFSLSWTIVHVDTFDMDNDGYDDIVILDDSWELNIFYWEKKGADEEVNFTKLSVSWDFWVEFDDSTTNDWWAIYYDWIDQQTSEDIDTYRYENLPYSVEGAWSGVSITNSTEVNLEEDISTSSSQTTFIKSEYSTNLSLEKTYTDKNWGFLQAGDVVDLEIKLKANSKLDDVAVMYDIPNNFKSKTELELEGEWKTVNIWNGAGMYKGVIDGFSMTSWEELVLKQELEMLPMVYWEMQVWLYESSGSLADDEYWDIILKDSNKNKWGSATFYESTSARAYFKTTISPWDNSEDWGQEARSCNWLLAADNLTSNLLLAQAWTKTGTGSKKETIVNMPWLLDKISKDSTGSIDPKTGEGTWNYLPDYLDEALGGILDGSWEALPYEQMKIDDFEEVATESIDITTTDYDCDCIPWWEEKGIQVADDRCPSFDESSDTFSAITSCENPFFRRCTAMVVDWEYWKYIWVHHGRPIFRFSKEWGEYCEWWSCTVELECSDWVKKFTVDATWVETMYSDWFRWNPISTVMKMEVYLPYSYEKRIYAPIDNRFHEYHFEQVTKDLDASSSDALQKLAEKLVDMGYDACAYEEEDGFVDKINVNGEVFDVIDWDQWKQDQYETMKSMDVWEDVMACWESKFKCQIHTWDGCNTSADACGGKMALPKSCEDIEWLDGDICDREVTSDLQVSLNEAFITLDQTITSDLASQTNWDNWTVANPWIIFAHDCQWYGKTFERMRPNQTSKQLKAVAWDHMKELVETCWKPIPWETYGFMVSGLVRMWASNSEVRSEIDWWIRDPEAWTFDEPVQTAENNPRAIWKGEFMSTTKWFDNLDNQIDAVSEVIDNILEWFSCGFGWCISTPLNWAPLAPWGDPVMFWEPVWDWFKIDEWIPVFSALTHVQLWYYCWPFVWPPSPLKKWGSCVGWLGAWWRLWTDNDADFLRLYLTPTLTGAMWMALCFWSPAKDFWKDPPEWEHPILMWWNCIVLAYPFFGCDWDSTGEPNSMGYPKVDASGDFSTINWNADEDTDKTGKWYDKSWRGPLVKIWNSSTGVMDASVSVDAQALINGDFSADPIKIELESIKWFPEFLMDWVDRQVKEIVDKITNLPTIYVVLPDFSWIFDDWWNNFKDSLSSFTDDYEKKTTEEKEKIDKEIDELNKQYKWLDCDWDDSLKCLSLDVALGKSRIQRNYGITESVSWIKTVYEFLGSIPLVRVKREVVDINIPMVDQTTINRVEKDRENKVQRRKSELSSLEDGSAIHTNFLELINSVERNIEIIEEYKNIPREINKLMSIKERRLNQILDNINNAFYVLLQWIPENWERFKAWVELYVLIKSILKTWQLFVDVFNDYDAECHVCKNERHDTFGRIVKLVSMMVPEVPIIEFPKWPDIVIDLHNIKAWLTIYLPDFDPNFRPIVLPLLPDIDVNADVKLPVIPELPRFELPTLPDIPVLPEIDLPDLPPPPTIPKLYGSVEIVLKIVKLILKIKCLKNNFPFFPEHKAGDQIAFLTERQWYLPIDFIDVSYPNFSYSFVDVIKLTTYVNLEFETDFITEMVENVVQPLNVFTNDVVNMFDYSVKDIDVQVDIDTTNSTSMSPKDRFDNTMFKLAKVVSTGIEDMVVYMQENKDVTLSNDEFIDYINFQLASEYVTKDKELDKIRDVWKYVWNINYSKEDKIIKELTDNANKKWNTVRTIIDLEKEKNTNVMSQIKELTSGQMMKQIDFDDYSVDVDWYNSLLDRYNQGFYESAVRLSNIWKYESEESAYLKEEGKKITDAVSSWVDSVMQDVENVEDLLAIDYKTYDETDFSVFPPSMNTPEKIREEWFETLSWSYFYNYKWIYITQEDTSYNLFDYLDEFEWDEPSLNIDVDGDGDNDIIYLMKGNLYFKENLKEDPDRVFLTLPPLVLDSDDNKFYNWDIFYEAVNWFNEISVSNSYINANFAKPLNSLVNNFRLEFYPIVDKLVNKDNNDYVPEDIKQSVIDAFANTSDSTLEEEEDNYKIRKNLAYIDYVWNNVPDVELVTNDIKNIKDDLEENKAVVLTAWKKLYSWQNSFYMEYFTWSLDRIKDVDMDSFTWVLEMVVGKYSNIEFDEKINIIGLTGDAYLEIDSEVVLKWIKDELEEEPFVEVPKWTNLYSPDEDVDVDYHTMDSTEIMTLTIEKWEYIELDEDVRITGVTGEVYVETDWRTRLVWQDIAEYIWKPLLPWAIIKVDSEENNFTESSHIDINYYDESKMEIDVRDIDYYELYELASSTDTYSIRSNLANDFYYARIKAFKDDIYWTPSKQILLSPQKEADDKAPEWDFNEDINVPINRIGEYDFTSSIYENSGIWNIEELYVDFDLDEDSDGDGITDNDNDNLENNVNPIININLENTGSIIKEKDKIALEFGPYDDVEERQIRIMAKDNNNNVWYVDLNFRVYAPDLSITSINNNLIEWEIKEPLWTESIGFYRIRFWEEERLTSASGSELVYSDEEGKFEFDIWNTASWVVLTHSWETIAEINEYTWKIKVFDEWKTYIDVDEPSFVSSPEISIIYDWNKLFTEKLDLSDTYEINVVDSFDDVISEWIYVKLEDKVNYNYYKVWLWIPYNPWAFVLYDNMDNNKKSLFTLLMDGKILVDNSNFDIRYAYYWDYIVYSIYNTVYKKEIAQILVRVEGNYVVE